ncbi:MAG TPA: hypothetical protein PKA27_07225 [Fimbriimonadaceae bacterium]|nr:hypothetical protein [Fimbriimonadaceae bacterium]
MNESIRDDIAALFEFLDDVELPDDDDVEGTSIERVGRNANESAELGRLSLIEGDVERAIDHFRRAIEQEGSPNADRTADLAAALEYADQEDEALAKYAEAGLLATSATALMGEASILRRQAKFRDAIALMLKAIQVEPENTFNRFKLAETLLEEGSPKAAAQVAIELLKIGEPNAYYCFWTGELLVRLARFEDALHHYRAAIDLSPGDDYYLFRSGVAMWLADRKSQAVRALRLAADLSPESALYPALIQEMTKALGEEPELAPKMQELDARAEEKLHKVKSELGL